jgi:hypothetical protein
MCGSSGQCMHCPAWGAHAPPRNSFDGTGIPSDEMNGRQAHRMSTFVLSLLMGAIGIALIVQAIGAHGSIVSPRLLLGVLFIAAGGGRIYLQVRRSREAS